MDDASGRKNNQRIYCANCTHCKLIRTHAEHDTYMLRIRCNAGKWRKRLGGEKLYKYCTVVRRSVAHCDSYMAMGEMKPFLKQLRISLPVSDEVYHTQTSMT